VSLLSAYHRGQAKDHPTERRDGLVHEHHIRVARTARYFALGNATDPEQVWFVCHGYSQLASDFIRYFAVLDDGLSYVVAPEALSRFYAADDSGPHPAQARVGATWMTREDRLAEIDDYVGYLDALYDHVFERLDRSGVTVRVLGFSQGAETASRWVDRGKAVADHVIVWGGVIPDDVALDRADTPFGRLKLSMVFGDRDEFASAERVSRLEARVRRLDCRLIRFAGGHQLNKTVLSELSRLSA
jgi:predicted esterase